MPSKSTLWRRANPDKHKAYLEKNKETRLSKQRDWINAIMQRRRELLQQYPCRCCGNDNPDVIQWHHVDPLTKKFNVNQGTHSEETFWDEVLKCIPVCANCHILLHKNKLCLINPTGYKPQQDTASTYVRDCTFPQSPLS